MQEDSKLLMLSAYQIRKVKIRDKLLCPSEGRDEGRCNQVTHDPEIKSWGTSDPMGSDCRGCKASFHNETEVFPRLMSARKNHHNLFSKFKKFRDMEKRLTKDF